MQCGDLALDVCFTITTSTLHCQVSASGAWQDTGPVMSIMAAAEAMSTRIFSALLDKVLRFVVSLGIVSPQYFHAEGNLTCPTRIEPGEHATKYHFAATFLIPVGVLQPKGGE